MNPIDANTSPQDDHRFDLLVDGELSEAQRRALLAGLDDEPGGWRRCALAFLEAQALKQDFGAILREPVERPTVGRVVRPRRPLGYGATLAAVAASFLVALFLGTQVSKWRRDQDLLGTAPVADASDNSGDTRPMPPPAPEAMLVDSPQPARSVPGPAISNPTYVAEFAGADGQSPPIRVPAVERERIDDGWLESLPAAISPEIVRQWERGGYPVRQRRRLLPFRLDDGRQLLVPVDEINIHNVNRPAL